jgi:hypothetical protein
MRYDEARVSAVVSSCCVGVSIVCVEVNVEDAWCGRLRVDKARQYPQKSSHF